MNSVLKILAGYIDSPQVDLLTREDVRRIASRQYFTYVVNENQFGAGDLQVNRKIIARHGAFQY